jgi:hypothetical protein
MNARNLAGYILLFLSIFLVAFDVPVGPEGQSMNQSPTVQSNGTTEGDDAKQAGPAGSPLHADEGSMVCPPEDPCLPDGFREWHEVSIQGRDESDARQFVGARVIVDRSNYHLFVEGIRPDGSVEDIYNTRVGLGDVETPTPEGRFLINHLYCYPDVLFFGENKEKIPGLYGGFFAPMLACDESGKCRRFRDLGIHGFDPDSYPHPEAIKTDSFGPSSAGCIRVPDPCAFKKTLIRLVGVGPVKRNERGCYHWLNRPVEIWVVDDSGILLSIVRNGFHAAGAGLGALLSIFGL